MPKGLTFEDPLEDYLAATTRQRPGSPERLFLELDALWESGRLPQQITQVERRMTAPGLAPRGRNLSEPP